MMLVSAGASRADQLKGNVSVQYQSTDDRTSYRSFLTRGFELNHATEIARAFNIRSRLEFRQSSYVQGQSGSVTPQGSIQVTHSLFGLNASYRPTRVTDVHGIETKTDQTTLNGYFGMPKLPRLDLHWTRRHMAPSAAARGGVGITRSAQLTHSIGRLNMHVGYGDQTQQRADPLASRTSQQNMTGGGSFQALAGPVATLLFQYDFGRTRNVALSGGAAIVRTHAATAAGGYKFSKKTDLGLNYSYRRSEIRSNVRANLDDQNGSLLLNYRPTGGTKLMAGGGVQTLRNSEGGQDLVGSLNASASASGRVRPGWTGQAGVARTINWLGGHAFAVDTWNAGSNFQFAPRLALNTNLLMTANGDTIAANSRDVAQLSYGLNASPLPSIRVAWRGSLYRSGPSFTRAIAHSKANSLDLQWIPLSGFELQATFSRASALPAGSSVSTTSRYTARWKSMQNVQLDLSYATSNEVRSGLGLDGLIGRKTFGAHLVMAPGRQNRVSAGINIADPGRATRTEQIDLTVTRNFGR